MSLKVGELFASITLDNKGFNAGVDQSEGKFRGLVGGVAKGGLVVAGALAGAGVAGGALAFKLANVAGDLNETVSKVNVVFGDLGQSLINHFDDAATSVGMSKQSALEAAGTYGNLFSAMGIGVEENREMSTSLVHLAADLASFNNQDPTEVLDKLRSGLTGETEPLKSLGVNLTAARVEAKALEMGLASQGEELTAAAKAQATYALILEDTKTAQGDFARTSDGMANQQRTLKATFEDTMAALGAAAVPIFEQILPMLTSALQGVAAWATDNSAAIGDTLAGVFGFIGDAITFLANDVIPLLVAGFTFFAEEVVPIIVAAISFVADEILPRLVAAFSAVAGWINDNGPTISSIVGQVFGAIASVVQAVWPVIEAVASVLFPALGAAASVLFSIMDAQFKLIGGVFEVFGAIAEAVFQAVTGIWEGLSGFFEEHLGGVGDAFKGAVNFIIDIVNGFLGFLNNLKINIPRIKVGPIDVGGGSIDPFNFGLIPHLARGGRILRDGLAVVGEEGPELVALGRGAEVIPNGAAMGGNVTVQMTVQPREVVDAHDIGLEARRLVRLGLRRQRRLAGAGA